MHKALKLLITLTLLYIAYIACTYSFANLAFKQAEKSLISWQNTEVITNTEQYDKALTNATNAINWHINPQYLEAKAQILEWGVRTNIETNKQQTLTEAKNLYIQSTQLRPTWPGTWAALALVKWHLGEYDEQMQQYLLNAHIFGKNTKQVHIIWSELGKALHNSENPAHKALIAPYLDVVDYHTQHVKLKTHAKPRQPI
ncbi:hypothetical protein AADZ86_02870 [Colwelliaceae bacterium BS250]